MNSDLPVCSECGDPHPGMKWVGGVPNHVRLCPPCNDELIETLDLLAQIEREEAARAIQPNS
jgi:hypothetical protein